jgi:hypothetical protein
MALAKAVFIESGTLVLGAHPSISPLVARVIQHYYKPRPAERGTPGARETGPEWRNPSLRMFQSEVWKELWADSTATLAAHPLVTVDWISHDQREHVDPGMTDQAQAPNSLRRMREAMIENTRPIAMVAIGGMSGVLEEWEAFRKLRPQSPVFALETTGGAAAHIAETSDRNETRVPDRNALALVERFWKGAENPELVGRERERIGRGYFVPYSVVAGDIVEQSLRQL